MAIRWSCHSSTVHIMATLQLLLMEIVTLLIWIRLANSQFPVMNPMNAMNRPNPQLIQAVKEIINKDAQPTQPMILISNRHRGPPRNISQLLEYTPHFVELAQQLNVTVPGVPGKPSADILRSHMIAKGTEWMTKINANRTATPGRNMGPWGNGGGMWNRWMRNQGGQGGGGGRAGGGAGGGGMGQWSSFMGQWANMLQGGNGGGAGGGGGATGATGGEGAAPTNKKGKKRGNRRGRKRGNRRRKGNRQGGGGEEAGEV